MEKLELFVMQLFSLMVLKIEEELITQFTKVKLRDRKIKESVRKIFNSLFWCCSQDATGSSQVDI